MGNRASNAAGEGNLPPPPGSHCAAPLRGDAFGDAFSGEAGDMVDEWVGGDPEFQDEEDPLQRMSYFQMAKVGYTRLCHAIIRPPRSSYDTEDLGPSRFTYQGRPFRRSDFEVVNGRGQALRCSHWEPEGHRMSEKLPCIIYLHGNSSSRLESLPQLGLCLNMGATMCAFDFAGSGQSDGEYVSLGYYERDDLATVIEYLRVSGEVGAISLWGRSMGAATALLHGDRDHSISAMVLDSAFADLTQLAEELVEQGRSAGLTLPPFVAKLIMRMIRGSVQKMAGFNIRELSPIAHADRTFIPALFVAAENDSFIAPHHSRQIHDAYAGDKNLVLVEGDHNSARPPFLMDSVYIFLQTCMQVPPGWALDGAVSHAPGSMPWNESLGEGLNPERQRELQAAMFDMLAQPRPPQRQPRRLSPVPSRTNAASSAPTEETPCLDSAPTKHASAPSNSKSTKTHGSADFASLIGGVEIIEDAESGREVHGKQINWDAAAISRALEQEAASNRGGLSPAESLYSMVDWVCSSCTLINEPVAECCAACGSVRGVG
jgi:pimeloyl-ACP methyl ester carboxylesterase